MKGSYINIIVRIYLFIFGFYHLITGIISVFFTNFVIPFNKFLYDFHPKMDNQLFLVSKPWGALAIFTGLVSIFAFKNPRQYRGVVYSLIVLLFIRAGYRYIYAQKIHEVVHMQLYRNYINIAIILLGAFLLLSWSIKSSNAK